MLTCASCGESNPERARFCLNCAAPLTSEPMAEVEERKVVTVLFCDLVGFTARAERSDPEDVRQLLDTYQARLRREIERFGGSVEKFIGDAVMAVFGAPVAHEDDAERGVRAALRILEAVTELNEAQPDLGLAVRIGVNTGEAVVAIGAAGAQGHGMVTGDVVNTASRLQGVAPEGGIVVGASTYRATHGQIDYDELEPVALKGKAEPVALWQALAARSRYGVDVDQRASTPFLGRGHELALLGETFQRAIDSRSVQLVTIIGEPGVGKSRLLYEFKSVLDDDPGIFAFWRQGRCLPYGEGVTFWALGEMVKGHAGILESDGPQEASEKLSIAVASVIDDAPQAEWVKARLGGLVGLTSIQVERRESFAAWRSFLEGIAGQRPLVLTFEDLHWADEALVEFLDDLVEWSTDVPILIVCTARPELFERHSHWAGGKRNAATLALSRLSDEDTTRLVHALLAQVALPAEIQRALLERAGGNPLFAEEYVRMLFDRGFLKRRGRTLAMSPDVEIPLPETIQATISARLDTLPPAGKALLHDASVIGKVFWSGALAAMSGIDEAAAIDELHDLSRKELVRRARTSSVEGQAEYAFWHALVRDVAYGQIPRAARARKHRQAAAWIRQTAGEREADVAELLAYHYEQALELSVAAGLDEELETLRANTRMAITMAGDRARSLDSRKAFAYYQRALELAPPGGGVRGGLLLATVETGSGEFGGSGVLEPAAAERMLVEATDAFRETDDPLGLGEALVLLSRQRWLRGAPDLARTSLTEAISILERAGPTRQLAEAYVEVARRQMLASVTGDGRAWAERAIELADQVGARHVVSRAMQVRGSLRIVGGDTGGLEDLRDALTLALETGRLDVIDPAYDNLADFLHDLEGPEAGLTVYRQGIEFLRGRGGAGLWMLGESTWPLFSLGRWDEMIRVADEVLAADRHDIPTQFTGLVVPEMARVLTYRSRPAEAWALVEGFLPRAREIRDPQILVRTLLAGAVTKVGRGDHRGAIDLMDEVIATGDPYVRYWALPEGARVLVAAGSVESARRLVEGDGTQPTMPNLQAAVTFGRAAIDEAEGRYETALGLYREASAWWTARGFMVNDAHATVGAARCELALGASETAAERLHQAGERFAGFGASALEADIDRILRLFREGTRARSG